MKHWTVALAQVNPTVGDLKRNADLVRNIAHRAREAGACVIVFPELVISGYPPDDLVLLPEFVRDCEQTVANLATQLPPDCLIILGCPVHTARGVTNSAIGIFRQRIAFTYAKMGLPNYGVFDEKRVFVPGEKPMVVDTPFARLGLQICEDSWIVDAPWIQTLRNAQPTVVVNLSASPYHRGKLRQRHEIIGEAAERIGAPLLYVNLIGGQDELVFDGASFGIGSDGRLFAQAPQFREELIFVSLPAIASKSAAVDCERVPLESLLPWDAPLVTPPMAEPLEDLAEVYEALKVGTRDYVEKNGFQRVIVALSGGIDSALVATIATDALGRERVVGITLPSRYNSEGTLKDAREVARRLGIDFYEVPIEPLFRTYLEHLSPLWKGREPDITEENLQARIRGNIVMALSNKFGWLVLATGNKSELATGYCTLYGDMVGGFAVIKDVPKTLVYQLAQWRNRQGDQPIPDSVIDRPPSAELRPNQKDTDTLPPYEILDAVLELYIEQGLGHDEIVGRGFNPDLVRRVIRMVDANEYKRRQGAPGIKITPKAFGRDRRMPITNRYRK